MNGVHDVAGIIVGHYTTALLCRFLHTIVLQIQCISKDITRYLSLIVPSGTFCKSIDEKFL